MRSRRSPSDVAFVIGTRELLDSLASTVRAQPFAAIGTAAIAGLAIGLLMRR